MSPRHRETPTRLLRLCRDLVDLRRSLHQVALARHASRLPPPWGSTKAPLSASSLRSGGERSRPTVVLHDGCGASLLLCSTDGVSDLILVVSNFEY